MHSCCHSDLALRYLVRDLVPRVTGPLEGVKLGFTETRPAYLQWNVSPGMPQTAWDIFARASTCAASD